MKLPVPFIRLPLRFDAQRLAQEVRALPESAWAGHPNGFPGNSAVRLISVEGGENDDVTGRMEMTTHLRACPYIQQVLAQFGVVWGRSRLMRLAPGARVPEHADMNYHWFSRVRIHIPVITHPGVSFYCGDQVVHMEAGDAWIFDNWRLHRVENATPHERIHLVADTSGSAAFWNLAASAQQGKAPQWFGYLPGGRPSLALERFNSFRVMPPSEVDLLLSDLGAEVQVDAAKGGRPADLLQFQSLLRSFCADWRQLWLLHGDSDEGLPEFQRLAQVLPQVVGPLGQGLSMRGNGSPALRALDARVVRYLVHEQRARLAAPAAQPARAAAPAVAPRLRPVRLDRPVFIVAAPRSGSTALFETLAVSPQWFTLGGEAHWLVEGFDHMAPGSPGVDDNRIDARHATPEVAAVLKQRLSERLQDPQGRPPPDVDAGVRFLEKTPKNALRIPFFAELFPDARFVFLWREPRENISSIIDAWRHGGWVTYTDIPGWDGPWSLLLPPGWRGLRGRSLAEVAAFQWETTNRIVLDDLQQLPHDRWMALSYAEFVADARQAVQRVCRFAGVEFDTALGDRLARPLPPSKHTLTRPEPDKWRKNATLVEPLLAQVRPTWDRLNAVGRDLNRVGRP